MPWLPPNDRFPVLPLPQTVASLDNVPAITVASTVIVVVSLYADPQAEGSVFTSYTLVNPASGPALSLLPEPEATKFPFPEIATPNPKKSLGASPSRSGVTCTQLLPNSSYIRIWPEKFPPPGL